ncbi:MAG: energy transducer TonB [Myxococcota bacterium]
MFDNIGTDLDEEAARRQAKSFAVTLATAAAVAGLVGAITYATFEEVRVTVIDSGPMVMLEAPPEKETALPAAPKIARGEPEAQPEDAPPEVPDELAQEIRDLQDDVSDQVFDAKAPAGTPDGDLNGVPDGDPEGTGEGPCEGPCGEVRVLHHSELSVKRRTQPDYPEAARALSLGSQRCLVHVFIGEDGVPYDVSVSTCPKVFHEPSRQAILQWRWYPPRDGKQRIKAQTTIAIRYQLE